MDWVSEWSKGRLIDNSLCTISMITVQDGQTSFTQKSRVVLFKGHAIGGIFGVPDKPAGFISFSIENDISVETKKIIADYQILSTAVFTTMRDKSIGKIVPIVFGKPGGFAVGYTDYVTFFDRLEASPAYSIAQTSLNERYIVAYSLIKATELSVCDRDWET